MAINHYHLALPVWNRPPWRGTFYTQRTRPADFLAEYASVFNAVEGNSTFYALPSAETVRKWRETVPPGFHFCWKVPRAITHDRTLVDAGAELDAFLTTIAPLGYRLGPCLLQLAPSFGPEQLGDLARFLEAAAEGAASRGLAMRWTVEVRHPAFYRDAELAAALSLMLADRSASRAVMDTRALRSAAPADVARPRPDEVAEDTERRVKEAADARRQKPNLPLPPDLSADSIGPTPMLRYVAHPDPAANAPWIVDWTRDVAAWILAGRHPYVVIHAPDDIDGAPIARLWHAALREAMAEVSSTAGGGDRMDIGELPPWPAERGRQLGLFN